MNVRAGLCAAMFLFTTVALSGCGSQASAENPQQDGFNPVVGRIEFNGKPVLDASVRLVPANLKKGESPSIPSALTLEDGTFAITTYVDGRRVQGAPAGDYEIELSWRGPLKGLSESSIDELKELLPKKYTKAKTSGLTCTVTAGENAIPPISLKSP